MLTPEKVKKILDDLVPAPARNFTVEFSGDWPAQEFGGRYYRKTRIIRLYPSVCMGNARRILGSALHEAAHHVNERRNYEMLVAHKAIYGRWPIHGNLFKNCLTEILTRFNSRYDGTFGGIYAYDPCRPVVSPHFISSKKASENCR